MDEAQSLHRNRGTSLQPSIADTAEDILQKLKDSGLKFTGKRKETVNLFVENKHRYLSAREVYEHVRQIYSSVSYDTIYRTLSTLLEHDVIEHLEFGADKARYRLKCHDHHHHHIVCVSCGATSPLDACPMDSLKEDTGDFKVLNHRFEIYGYCHSCQGDGASST